MQRKRFINACFAASIILIMTLLSVIGTSFAQGQQSTATVTIYVKDGVTGTAAQGVTTSIESASGVTVQKLGTVPAGGTQVSLPTGSYNIIVQIDIFNYPVTLVSYSLDLTQSTTVELTVTAIIVPIQYLPLLVYIAIIIIIIVIIYSIIRRLMKPKGPIDPATGKKCSIVAEGAVWKPPARPADAATGKPCSIVVDGAVWKPAEPPKDPATGKTCSISVGGSVYKPPEPPKDPATGKPCSISVDGAVYKPSEKAALPKDPATGKTCSISTGGTVWKAPPRPNDPATGKPCSIVVDGAIWKPPEPPKDPATGKICSISTGGTVYKSPEMKEKS